MPHYLVKWLIQAALVGVGVEVGKDIYQAIKNTNRDKKCGDGTSSPPCDHKDSTPSQDKSASSA